MATDNGDACRQTLSPLYLLLAAVVCTYFTESLSLSLHFFASLYHPAQLIGLFDKADYGTGSHRESAGGESWG